MFREGTSKRKENFESLELKLAIEELLKIDKSVTQKQGVPNKQVEKVVKEVETTLRLQVKTKQY
jgi:hypothetical protein